MTLKSPQQNPDAGPPLAPPFQAERRETDARAGPMTHWVTGQGAPLLVLHSINAAASAAEIRPIVEHARTDRRVWAPDLPGFGFSGILRRVWKQPTRTDWNFDQNFKRQVRLPDHAPEPVISPSKQRSWPRQQSPGRESTPHHRAGVGKQRV